MRKIILLVWMTLNMQAQHKVIGKFTNSNDKIKSVALYQLYQGRPTFRSFSKVKDSLFVFAMDSTYTPGYYRAFYLNASTGYVDFIYNNEDVAFTLSSEKGKKSLRFNKSKENQLFDEYSQNIALAQYRLDSTNVAYIKNHTKVLKDKFFNYYQEYQIVQNYYQEATKGMYCSDLIKASAKKHQLSEDSQSYMDFVVGNYLKNVDFDNQNLRNATFLFDRSSEYVFYLHQSEDVIVQNRLYEKAVNTVLQKTKDVSFRGKLMEHFAQEFIRRENKKLLDIVLDSYEKLPLDVKSQDFINSSRNRGNTLYGAIAPEIFLNDKGDKASELGTDKYYLLVFWSSVCGHCKVELPRLYEKLKDDKNFTVVAVGMENEEDKEKWEAQIAKMPNFHHLISLGKWEGEYAKKYDIRATPTYFVLNKDFRIVGKPYQDKDVDKFIGKK